MQYSAGRTNGDKSEANTHPALPAALWKCIRRGSHSDVLDSYISAQIHYGQSDAECVCACVCEVEKDAPFESACVVRNE